MLGFSRFGLNFWVGELCQRKAVDWIFMNKFKAVDYTTSLDQCSRLVSDAYFGGSRLVFPGRVIPRANGRPTATFFNRSLNLEVLTFATNLSAACCTLC